jgi:PAS domain S-box-containing protein
LPLRYKGHSFGVLVMLSHNGELNSQDRVKFAEAVATQISQALAVALSFKRTERSEQLASKQSSLLRSILESIADGVIVADEGGRFIDWNPAAEKLVDMGRRRKPDEAPISDRSAERSQSPAREQLPLARAILGENVRNMEMFVRQSDAPDGRWLSVNAQPWRDDKGTTRGGVAVLRDVTQEKATQSQLMVSDRMASVGMLAAGVAHEINNPLAAVLANLELAHQDLKDGIGLDSATDLVPIREMIADAREAADRVRQIVRDLKIFSRHEDAPSGSVDIRRVLDSSLRMAWNEIRHRAKLEKSFEDVPPVEGTDSRLGQVFLNLIVNAAQAVPLGAAEKNRIFVGTRMDPSGRVLVEITDSGSGMAPENLRHLFTPFFSTKPSGVGTGLGLAICHRIVTGLGGEIKVETELGKGTTFRVLLRRARSVDSGVRRAVEAARAATRRGRLLVIDDEPLIGAVIKRALSSDHEVVTTTNAAEALLRIRGGEKFDLILCDLMMPQMTGVELHARLQVLGPEWADRLVFLTGGAFTPATRAFLETVPNDKLEKPFDTQALRALVNARIR